MPKLCAGSASALTRLGLVSAAGCWVDDRVWCFARRTTAPAGVVKNIPVCTDREATNAVDHWFAACGFEHL